MRRIILFSILAMHAYVAAGQSSLNITSLQSEAWGNTDALYIQATGVVENVSGSSVAVKVRATEIDVVPGTLNYFCWAQCYEPGITVSPSSITLAPNESTTAFYGDYVPQGQSGTSAIRYCFFNVANEADSVCGVIRFSANPVGLGEIASGSLPGVSRAYPNPASQNMFIDYVAGERGGRIDIYSMLGVKVQSMNLVGEKGRAQLNVSGLPAGMYLYRLVVNGQDVQTKRFNVVK
jgi:hypothetical protein